MVTLTFGINKVIDTCEANWTDATGGKVTPTNDTSDFKVGSKSVKLVVAPDFAGDAVLAYNTFSSLDIDTAKFVGMWVKSDTALAAADLSFVANDVTNWTTPLVKLDLPSLNAGEWTLVLLYMSDASTYKALIRAGLYGKLAAKSCTIHVDQITCQPSLDFNELDLQGVDTPESIDNFPALVEQDLEGSYQEAEDSGFQRRIGLDLGVIPDRYAQKFLFRWSRDIARTITIGSETISVMPLDKKAFDLPRRGQVPILKGYKGDLIEKTTREADPTSWL